MRSLLLALLLLSACSRRGAEIPHYPAGAAGLRAFWSDLLQAARRDDRDRVHQFMASTLLSDAEFDRLLGPRAAPLRARYHHLMAALINRGGLDLVGQVYEKKLDTVDVIPDDTEAQLQAALKEPHPLFSARVRKASDQLGLRYDGYLYLDGRWRTLNQLNRFMDAP